MSAKRERWWAWSCWLAGSLLLAGATAADDAAGPPTPPEPCVMDTASFPSYPAIEPNVEFWKRVYGEWTQGQVAVHDLEHPAIVYELVDLPGPVEERYTAEQQRFVEQLLEAWQAHLRDLAAKVLSGAELNDAEKRLALEIATRAGSEALADAHQRVRTQRGLRERFRRGLEIAGRYDAVVREVLARAGVPADLAYLPHVESSYQAAARSSAGAVGVWQFTRSTGRNYLRIDGAIDERLDPILAARGAAAYLREAHDRIGDWALALTSYNHGLYGMMRAAEQHGRDYERVLREYRGRLFGFASRNFYSEFLAAREVACDPERYFPEGLTPEAPHDAEEVVLGGRTSHSRLAAAWGVAPEQLTALNPAWTSRALRADLSLPAGSTVWLPADTVARLGGADAAALAWAAQPAPAQDRAGVHVVRPGDSLSSIASRYGMSVARLRALNGIAPREDLIRVGQRLELQAGDAPPSALDRLVHVVRRGDTLVRIALRYGVSLAELLVHNGLTAEATIYPGQVIRIP